MDSFGIGLSGLSAAQRSLQIIGNNIANAATEGYHRQKLDLRPAGTIDADGVFIDSGVIAGDARRMIDELLEKEILTQRSVSAQTSRELSALKSIESVLGELTESNLGGALGGFLMSFKSLAADPQSYITQTDVVNNAESMVSFFHTTRSFLDDLDAQVTTEAHDVIEQINSLTEQIADMNNQIKGLDIRDADTSNIKDRRDQAISDLADLVGITTRQEADGVVDVSIGGVAVVLGSTVSRLEGSPRSATSFGLSVEGMESFSPEFPGGKLGGLISLKNEYIGPLVGDLDTLAETVINEINKYHVQGVPAYDSAKDVGGSFLELSGWGMPSTTLDTFVPSVTDGGINVRVTDTATGQISREGITVDADVDTLVTIAGKLDAINGISASVRNEGLHIEADANFKFDFLPGALPEPVGYSAGYSGTAAATVGGTYISPDDETYTFNMLGSGTVGVTDGLQLEIQDSAGAVVNTLEVGAGYAAGSELTIDPTQGLKISFSAGEFVAGESFTVEAVGNSDTSGLLASAGVNTFFRGRNASDISLDERIKTSPGLIATSLGSEMTDNANVSRIADIAKTSFSELGSMTIEDFYRNVSVGVSRDVSMVEMKHTSTEDIMQSLLAERDTVSGVDINNEAAQMLIFQQMFQAMAQYMNTVKGSLDQIMQII